MRNATKKCILVNEIKKLKSNLGTFLKTKQNYIRIIVRITMLQFYYFWSISGG